LRNWSTAPPTKPPLHQEPNVRRADHRFTALALAALLAGCANPERQGTPDNEPTLASLAARNPQLPADPGIRTSSAQAVTAYRRLLETNPPAAQRSEAMRRLGDLEMQLADDASASSTNTAGSPPNYARAVAQYQSYLQAHPKDPNNDRVLYQLARAQELGGQLEPALATLDRIAVEHPNTRYGDEIAFRRGELLFNFGKYPAAEKAYEPLIARKEQTPFYDRALYMHGWSQFKQGRLEEGLASFFTVLDLKVAGRGDAPLEQLQGLSRADRELVEDTFRITSISLSNLQGAEALPKYMTGAPDSARRSYEFRAYEQLGELYLKQERVKDAADTFAAFARRQPLHAQAPALQARVIGIYEQGGLPTLAMSAKKDYVSNYGARSEFRQRNPQGWESTAQPLVKTHLAELARHHHAQAQKSKTSADYQEAARWYREIITSFPKEPSTARDHFLLSELLYEDKRWAEAATEYDRAAYDYPKNDKSADAAYTGLLARTQLEKAAAPADAATLQRASVAAALKFGDSFKADARTGPVLTNAAEKLFNLKDGEGAVKVAQQVIALNPPAAPEQQRVAWTVVSHTTFDQGQFDQAEKAYAQVIALTPATPASNAARNELIERQAAAVYKQGEKARDAGDARVAVGHFNRVAQVPGLPVASPIQAAAHYDAATALIALKDWNGASASLESFRERFPQNRLVGEASGKLAAIYLEQERFGPAALEFERQAAAHTDPAKARDTLWQAALLHEKADAKPAALRVYERYAKQYPEPLDRSLEARWKIVQAEGEGSPKRLATMREIRDLDARAGAARTDRTRTLGGLSALALSKPLLDDYQKVALVEPLQRNLKLKKDKMQVVLQAYAQASEYGVAEVVTAATFQTAAVYQDFGKAMLDSQRPKGLKPAALEQYNVLLEEQAFPFEEKAIELHEVNAKRASTGLFDEWVQKSFAALRTLKPGRYAKSEKSDGAIDAIR
jgi:cellulose synthase operon protein C